ncbi:radical SAM superfamily enzyme YgiQ (UPF0313 family) [Aequitasia blattaphilus]|uniref:B12-binding domain-containing radical SAM protein n=1 Tax=Aequitasia blattaphilus TaxID=2949332 RepID=A0ABT1ECP5_9FIRM|nr:radical SAM protein [Aequitasia blattaphilus]MCP1103621.1 B12-binding domain-containing radical SAM protein [Aequitasia blattaphilus]MCR8616261.1 B12-binding domain-containing radical SAM protein [Aequitasia blattaphilus]
MRYEGAIYRPPSEARSLIIQLTIGCARNTCTFCSMFKDKKFRIRPLEDVIEDLETAREYYKNVKVRRVFLADGDALIVKTEDLLCIINKINELFPEVERISAYGAPADVLGKTVDELKQLRQAGLEMVYMGAESGDDEVLTRIKKGVTAEEIIKAGQKLKKSGIITSVTFISGLGGSERLNEHALNTAYVINKMNPEYVGFLTLMLESGTELYEQVRRGEFRLLELDDIITELKVLIENIDSPGTVFRSNHASNYVPLKGTFNEDRDEMLKDLREVMESGSYKPEKFRGL